MDKMEVVYYPGMYVRSERLLKQILLLWGTVKTIVPPSQKRYLDAYFKRELKETNYALERYREIYDIAGDEALTFLMIDDGERKRASEQMLDLLTTWNADTAFYDSLKIRSVSDFVGKEVEWYWFLHEKIEWPLVELMLQEQLVMNWAPGEIVGFQEIGKAYMSVIAGELQSTRRLRLLTDDEFYSAARSPVWLKRSADEGEDSGYTLASMAIPQVFFDCAVLDSLTWKQVFKIRKDLLPFSARFYGEVESYQQQIDSFAAQGQADAAFDKFCEFCERVAISFRPFAKEAGKLLRLSSPENFAFLNGIVLPAVKLFSGNPDLEKVCDVAALASTAGSYFVSDARRRVGFEYLENLNRKL